MNELINNDFFPFGKEEEKRKTNQNNNNNNF